MKFLLPLVLLVLGTGAGVGAGLFLKPGEAGEDMTGDCPAPSVDTSVDAGNSDLPDPLPAEELEYVKINNQFVVPVVVDDRVRSLVVMSLSVETNLGGSELIYAHEPKLRDLFLQVMFDHANSGGFQNGFTNSSRLDVLRKDFRAVARRHLGDAVRDVLITDIAKQDI